MRKYRCKTCEFIYDESKEKILFNNLPDDWICPLCNDTKEEFELIEENIEVLKYKSSRIPMEACLAYKFLIII